MIEALDKNRTGRILQYTIYNLLPPGKQYREVKGEHIWLQDWTDVEVLKILHIGEERYRQDPPPFRARGNPFFNLDRFLNLTSRYLVDAKGIMSTTPNELEIPNCGRGILIFLVSYFGLTPDICKITTWDDNILYRRVIEDFFPGVEWTK